MLIKIGLLFIGFIFGYSICYLMMMNRITILQEKAFRRIEFLQKVIIENQKNIIKQEIKYRKYVENFIRKEYNKND